MVSSGSRSHDETEYDAIESALAETERGRRFLAEFARRHRGADTDTLLQAIARLESAVTRDAAAPPDDLRETLSAMAESIAAARADIAGMTLAEGHEGHPASETLDTLVRGTERATSEILGAAEAMQEAAWSLREKGADAALCDVLDRRAITIYTACSVQDLSAQRTARAVAALHELETRLAGLLGQEAAAPGEPPAAPPPLPEDDIVFVSSEPPPIEPEPRPAAGKPDDADDLALAFADLDRLSIEGKIALFS